MFTCKAIWLHSVHWRAILWPHDKRDRMKCCIQRAQGSVRDMGQVLFNYSKKSHNYHLYRYWTQKEDSYLENEKIVMHWNLIKKKRLGFIYKFTNCTFANFLILQYSILHIFITNVSKIEFHIIIYEGSEPNWQDFAILRGMQYNGISSLIKDSPESSFGPFVVWGRREKICPVRSH